MKTVACVYHHQHVVEKQAAANDCGPTCLRLAYRIVKGASLASANSLFGLAQPNVLTGRYTGAMPTNLDDIEIVAKLLGMNTKLKLYKSYGKIGAALHAACTAEKTVAIAHIRWNKGGGHFVVLDRMLEDPTEKGAILFCVSDPGSEEVQSAKWRLLSDEAQMPYSPSYSRPLTLGKLQAGKSPVVVRAGVFTGDVLILS